MPRSVHHCRSFQKGAAALLLVVVLSLVMGAMSLTTTTVGVMEQRVAGNDLRAREAQEAAQAGLDYGMAWAGKEELPWGDTNRLEYSGSTSELTLPTITGSSTGESYSIRLVYARENAGSTYIRITSNSTGTSDSSIAAMAEAVIRPLGILSRTGASAPPLVMGGCMQGTTGTPAIYPKWTDRDNDGVRDPNEWIDTNGDDIQDPGEWTDTNGNGNVDNEMGVAIATSQPLLRDIDGDICLDYCGPGKGKGVCDPEVDPGRPHLDLNSGTTRNNLRPPISPLSPPSIWNYYFDITPTQFRVNASTTLSTTGGSYWISDSGNWSNGTYGSEDNPVTIVFENGCPKPGGNTTVYGVLFFFDDSDCDMNGWGNVTVYGSLGVTGGVKKMNANLTIHDFGTLSNGGRSMNPQQLAGRLIPGTWKDF
jgi:Tfp pilus assembly protein PilX